MITIDRPSPSLALLRIDDPASGNRLSERMCAEFEQAVAALAEDTELRVLLLAGSPRVFCAGATIESLRRIAGGALDVKDLATARCLLAAGGSRATTPPAPDPAEAAGLAAEQATA